MTFCLHVHKTTLMHDVLRLIGHGYQEHFGGRVHASKAVRFVEKMDVEYGVLARPAQRSYRHRMGRANASIFVHPLRDTEHFGWFILLTPGDHIAREREALKDVKEKKGRLRFDERFEAIKTPREGGRPVWTWRLLQTTYDGYTAQITTAIRTRKNDDELRSIIHSMEGLPGFNGVNKQRAGIIKHIHREWGRTRNTPFCPYVGKYPRGFVGTFRTPPKLPLAVVSQRVLDGERPFAPEEVRSFKKGSGDGRDTEEVEAVA